MVMAGVGTAGPPMGRAPGQSPEQVPIFRGPDGGITAVFCVGPGYLAVPGSSCGRYRGKPVSARGRELRNGTADGVRLKKQSAPCGRPPTI